MPILTIVRGIPGSGKSTIAKQIVEQTNALHYEADMYFTDDQGNYNFDRDKLRVAHDWCNKATYAGLYSDRNVVVTNTFIKFWEVEKYAKEFTYLADIEIITATGNYQNTHKVDQETIDRMRATFEHLDPSESTHIKIPMGGWEDFVFDVYRQRVTQPSAIFA